LFGMIFTLCLISVMQPSLFGQVLNELKKPSLFGR
jgi:hypothetical protein